MKKLLIFLLCFILFFCAGAAGVYAWNIHKQKKEIEALKRREEEYTAIRQNPLAFLKTEENEGKLIPVDFERLQSENRDIYAWITIPGTLIDYPVVQNSEDNTYDQSHSSSGDEDALEVIFTENYNSRDFKDFMTVIYGADGEDGSGFGGLRQYEDNIFMDEHKYIYIYTMDHIYQYCVFAAYLSDDRHLMVRFNSGTTEGNRQAYIDAIMDQRVMGAQIDKTAPVDTDSHILTLSTHDLAGEQYRYLVQAYLTEEIV